MKTRKSLTVKKAVPTEPTILTVRGTRVVLDNELARVYGVTTARLNQQIRRNRLRFPEDFAFKLTEEEYAGLMLQNATSNVSRGGRRKLPFVFTEHGAIMAANVLRSPRALEMSVFVVRTFVRLRQGALLHHELAARLKELETRVGKHDEDIKVIIDAIRQLMLPPEKPRKEIGFKLGEPKVKYKTAKSSYGRFTRPAIPLGRQRDTKDVDGG